jgi:hypothetical protein
MKIIYNSADKKTKCWNCGNLITGLIGYYKLLTRDERAGPIFCKLCLCVLMELSRSCWLRERSFKHDYEYNRITSLDGEPITNETD